MKYWPEPTGISRAVAAIFLLGTLCLVSPWGVAAEPMVEPIVESGAGGETGAAGQAAADETEIPPALTHYMEREIAQTMHFAGAPWLMRETRQREEDCSTMLKALKVKRGQRVCDMGCGNGFYTLKLARLVGEKGTVVAVDIQSEMLHMLEERAKEARVKNIELVQGTVADPMLPPGELDLILLVDVYHEFSHPEQMLAAMHGALKPKGRLALVEFRLEDPAVPIKLVHKMSKEQITKELTANGYKLVEEFDKLPWQHLMFFEPVGDGGRIHGGGTSTKDTKGHEE